MNFPFNGLGLHLGNLPELSNAVFRSISAENPNGEKGKGAMSVEGLAEGPSRANWVVVGKSAPASPSRPKKPQPLAEISGPGAIQHIWITVDPASWRRMVLRIYWDDEPTPSVETPSGRFLLLRLGCAL